MPKEEIAILREKIKNYLETSSDYEKLTIPKELLEDLLFEIIEVNIKGKLYKVKVPIWSGKFLSKVDLSEINFKDVLWNYDVCVSLNGPFDQILEATAQIRSTYPTYATPPYEICYANTNAQIDLTESFLFNYGKSTRLSTKYNGLVSVAHCNFSGTDVRFSEEVKALQLLYSNFSKSGISIPNIGPLTIRHTDLSDNDLSHLCINGLSNLFYGTSFRNSGINVNIDTSELELYIKLYEGSSKNLYITMFNDYFVGCNVNGNYLNSHKDEEYNLRLILKRER